MEGAVLLGRTSTERKKCSCSGGTAVSVVAQDVVAIGVAGTCASVAGWFTGAGAVALGTSALMIVVSTCAVRGTSVVFVVVADDETPVGSCGSPDLKSETISKACSPT